MEEALPNQLSDKERLFLEEFSTEWNKRRLELENEITEDIKHCKDIINHLNSITDEVKMRAYATAERENKLRLTKEQLNTLYQNKYYELREATKRTQHHFQHKMQVQELHAQELRLKIEHLEKTNASLKERVSHLENNIANLKKSSISQEEAAALNNQMELLNKKLAAALQSRSYFKDKWVTALKKSKDCNEITTPDKLSLQHALVNEESLLLEDQAELQKLKKKLENAAHLNDIDDF